MDAAFRIWSTPVINSVMMARVTKMATSTYIHIQCFVLFLGERERLLTMIIPAEDVCIYNFIVFSFCSYLSRLLVL